MGLSLKDAEPRIRAVDGKPAVSTYSLKSLWDRCTNIINSQQTQITDLNNKINSLAPSVYECEIVKWTNTASSFTVPEKWRGAIAYLCVAPGIDTHYTPGQSHNFYSGSGTYNASYNGSKFTSSMYPDTGVNLFFYTPMDKLKSYNDEVAIEFIPDLKGVVISIKNLYDRLPIIEQNKNNITNLQNKYNDLVAQSNKTHTWRKTWGDETSVNVGSDVAGKNLIIVQLTNSSKHDAMSYLGTSVSNKSYWRAGSSRKYVSYNGTTISLSQSTNNLQVLFYRGK